MPIPKEILAVERPVNTVVIAYGKNKDHYAVRQRMGCRNVDGRHLPVNGPTIGHIVDGKYISLPQIGPLGDSPVDLKDWAGVTLCDSLFRDVCDELRAIYNEGDALKIYCIAVLRVCEPGVKDCELKEAYDTSFLSELYPGVALSKNTVSQFERDLGKTCSRITAFMRLRTAAVGVDDHLLVDGTLKSDESKANSLSDFSRKARTKGTRDLSVMYAFDLEKMEPVCSKCFPGNMLDETAYSAFIEENGIKSGLLVTDKGIPASAAAEQFEKNPNLHYLNPIKRNARLIKTHNMLDFTGILPGFEGVTFRKEKVSSKDKWLYGYRDASRAANEERDFLGRARKNKDYDLDKLREKQKQFGTVVLESDLDLAPQIAYKAYSSRWEIEIVMRYYKSALEFDETRVHSDWSVIGSEFCDFLASVLTFRLLDAFDRAGLLEKMTYKKIMSILRRAKNVRMPEGNWQLIKTSPSHIKVLQSLDLLPTPDNPPKRKRGRPRKNVI